MSKITTARLLAMKQARQKIAMITAYDATFATLFEQAGVHAILIGDSLGMVLQGEDSTLKVTVADIAYHTRCVANGSEKAMIVADMPFMSYSNPEQACTSAAELMRAGAHMVKLEGGDWLTETVTQLTRQGIPVCGHLGLTPQSVHVFGGFKLQGRDTEQADQIKRHARALEAAGIQLLVLECVPSQLATDISQALSIPVIGIGAGPDTDGQVLVMQDALGLTSGYVPKFTKNFLADNGNVAAAIEAYVAEVADGRFPGPEHSFN
ncbi:3-methyl-2-oxobutanoate hydroxymethyltransferase [Oceanisphaera psychrotolerans]|uniref:3-methyl-2-oxobutanoate hydroxymethyltransferase n=1 Tax=Oceanisphaera psychrotolerans TaxID=1414654 RepID=A0A1J4QGU9_9GAMM|nr:3-methyl-2-oxobutanoate hydroxymethyltransferase [Oceanisphaera psychrotolerans]OIN09623.1 3-methyl-2-oxobutanoate hydroxymethyltransferase [Oceanisphaera psychrotolerans]